MAKPSQIEMSMDELLALPVAIPLEIAGRAWGFGRGKCFELKKQDKLPFRWQLVGSQVRVTKADLFASLGLNLDGTPTIGTPDAARGVA